LISVITNLLVLLEPNIIKFNNWQTIYLVGIIIIALFNQFIV